MVPRIITLAIGMFFGPYYQSPPFELQAITRVRQLNISFLDSALQGRTFASWLQKLVGPRAGITWQLTECGAAPGSTGELQACVEMSAILPDERKVVILTWVGSFKRGIYGEPRVQFAVVESNGELFEASRLRDLPQMLRKPLLRSSAKRTPVPATIVFPLNGNSYFPAVVQPLPSREPADNPVIRTSIGEKSAGTVPQRVSEGVLLGSASTRVLPAYPEFAKQLRVSGEVKVEITIDVNGRVIEAHATSGPYPLRPPAEAAARKWIFNPTLLNKVPVSVRGNLTFIFAKP